MIRIRLQLFMVLFLVTTGTTTPLCSASDGRDAFLQGLRGRGYFDTALQYIDSLGKDPDTSDRLRTTLKLKRATIWLDRSTAARRPDERDEFASRALASFEAFLSEHPRHSRVAWTHEQMGRLLMARARQKLWTRNAPNNSIQRDQLTDAGRQLLARAKEAFIQARDLSKTQLATLPFVTREEDEAGYQLRRRTEFRYQQTWLNFVECLYEEALTYDDPESEKRLDLLKRATAVCEEIRTFSREGLGQSAKLMMGKCRLQMGDINQALGYFDELRNQPSQQAYMLALSRAAQYNRLVCLNHESRQEFRNVVNEATRWLKQNRAAINTEAGLGILYEKTIASEALARDEELSRQQRQLRLRKTLADLNLVSAVLSPVQEPARAAARRLRDELGQDRREPKNFETAFDRGREIIGQLQELRNAVQLAENDEQQMQATQQLELFEAEAGRMFQLALQFRKPDSDHSAVAQARYLLSYVFLQQRKSYDAFVLSRHVMRRHSEHAGETAASASEMAISAAVQIWAAASKDDRMFELQLVHEICEEVIGRFPGSRHATDGWMRLGRIHLELEQPQQAAEAFQQVPRNDAGYAAACIEAGQAWWLAWAQAGSGSKAQNRTPIDTATLSVWKQRAIKLLTEGVKLSRDSLTGSSLSDDIVRAEVSLSSLMNEDGKFTETVRRLTQGNPTVLSAIESSDERPERGVKSPAFAGLCYRTLLRAYVGTQQIDDALSVMRKLQTLGSTNTTAIYAQLGREFQKELKRLRDAGKDEQYDQVRTSFREFLEQVYESRDATEFGALLWIGDTYAGLARETEDAEESTESFARAVQTYQQLIQLPIDEPTAAGVRLRLIRIYRRQRNYRRAVELGTEVLTNNAASVSVQLEIAHVLADWGEHGEPERLLESIGGTPSQRKGKIIWGWAALARRLQKSRQQKNWTALKPLFLEARYELSRSRLRYARINPDSGQQQLEAAARELTSMAQVFDDLDQEWRGRFDGLYQEVRKALGRPGLVLFHPGDTADSTENGPAADDDLSVTGNTGAVPIFEGDPNQVNENDTPDSLYLIVGISLMAVVVIAGSFVIMRQSKKRIRRRYGNPSKVDLLTTKNSGVAVAKQMPSRRSSGATADGQRKSQFEESRSRSGQKGQLAARKAAASRRPRDQKRPSSPENQ
ncbi:MAG: tetratricopeptide repeat protein [Fuerstiella sp.]|nr:tetratricopeptide repeat protein [Fuerstiella sp.]